jgi:hypothetical protein
MASDEGEKRPRRAKGSRPRRTRDDAEAAAKATTDATSAPATAYRDPPAPAPASAFVDPQLSAVGRPLIGAAAVTALGVVLVGIGPSDLGMAACLLGGFGLIASIHRLGRLGAGGVLDSPGAQVTPASDGRP